MKYDELALHWSVQRFGMGFPLYFSINFVKNKKHDKSGIVSIQYKYQVVKNFTRWLVHHLKSRLARAFPSCMNILTSCGHFHLAWAFSPHMHTRWHSKVRWGVPSTIWKVCSTFSPHVDILTWRGFHTSHTYLLTTSNQLIKSHTLFRNISIWIQLTTGYLKELC